MLILSVPLTYLASVPPLSAFLANHGPFDRKHQVHRFMWAYEYPYRRLQLARPAGNLLARYVVWCYDKFDTARTDIAASPVYIEAIDLCFFSPKP
ncbi:hypothetical protein AYO49_00590 [Verrucomicrobiaceae bacterium SCGC AG-212-N21]|nr:hypothetical protein AYO49_00590 [Verrucomicrobiaceae bacterium SCGC AG-212-N21]